MEKSRQPERVDLFKVIRKSQPPDVRGADTGLTKRQAAEHALDELAKRRQARTGEDYYAAYAAIMGDNESKPHRAALYARDAHLTATELAKSARDDLADLRELQKLGAPTYWAWIKGECERRSPGHWEDSLNAVALEFPGLMEKAHRGR
jgi:hypothetical protein